MTEKKGAMNKHFFKGDNGKCCEQEVQENIGQRMHRLKISAVCWWLFLKINAMYLEKGQQSVKNG